MFKKYIRKLVTEVIEAQPPNPYILLDDDSKEYLKERQRRDIDWAVKNELNFEVNIEIKDAVAKAFAAMVDDYEEEINSVDMLKDIVARINSLQLLK